MSTKSQQQKLYHLVRKAAFKAGAGGRKAGMLGNIDSITDGRIHGWVKSADSDSPLHVDILLGGKLLRSGLSADEHRQDVQAAGIGTGRYGFIITVPRIPKTKLYGKLIEVRNADDGTPLLKKRIGPSLFVEALEEMDSISKPVTDEKPRENTRPVQKADASTLYDCRIEQVSDDGLRGWAVDKKKRGRVFDVDILIDGVPLVTRRTEKRRRDLQKAGKTDGLGGFDAALRLAWLEQGQHELSIRTPDGLIAASVRIQCGGKVPQPQPLYAPRITPVDIGIIIPVYNAYDDVVTCIDRLARFTSPEADILFINDASPDPRIAGILQQAQADWPNMRVLTNEENLGFTRTINRGIDAIGRKHPLLLNSDARVTPGWLEGILRAANSRPRVATVTPMSDRAGAFSAPRIGNDNNLPAGVDEITYSRAFRRRGLGIYPIVPTGNGFCMFINRSCVEEIGPLDAGAFPRGYGEENDFCMRAGRAGWTHLIDDRTYVFHDRSKSFGDAKTELMEAGRKVIDVRYPEYKKSIGVFTKGPEILMARFRALQAMLDCAGSSADLPPALFVVSTRTGGTPQTNLDLMTAVSDEVNPWLLHCDSAVLTLSRMQDGELYEIKTHRLEERVDPIRHSSGEYDAVVAEWLEWLAPEIVHIRHLGWHGLSLPRLAREQGAGVVLSFHDFYALCPTVKLLDGDGVFCGGKCTASDTPCTPELWRPDSMPPLKDSWVHVWRDRFSDVMKYCDAFVTTSDSARERIIAHLPGIDPERFFVIPHGRNFTGMEMSRVAPREGEPVRILIPGSIGPPKGLEVIRQLVEHDEAGLLEFHVLGRMGGDNPIIHPRVIEHGTYKRHEFSKRAKEIGAHLGAIFSIWDETYCHTLTELWSAGLPAFVLDYPTVATRVRRTGAGWVLPRNGIDAIYDEILRIAHDSEEQNRAESAVADWQQGRGLAGTTQMMAAHYRNVYASVRGQEKRPIIGVVAPSALDLKRAFASTEIRVWERTRNAADRSAIFVRMAPPALKANLQEAAINGAIIQRNAIPPSLIDPVLDAFSQSGISYVMELDDNLMEVPADKDPNGVYRDYAPELEKLVRSARIVTTSTEPLREELQRYNADVRLVPNRLSERLWRGALPAKTQNRAITALYMGTYTHSADLEMIQPALAAMAAANPDFRLAMIGVLRDEELPNWIERVEIPDAEKDYQRFIPWVKSLSGGFDFAVAPLVDSRFNRHKSNLKALDYAALGLPVLASDMPVYRRLGDDMPGLTLVENTTEEWTKALKAAIARARTGEETDRESIRRWVFSQHGLATSLPGYDALLEEVLRQ